MKRSYLFMLMIVFSIMSLSSSYAQNLTGVVKDLEGNSVEGATVFWAETTVGTMTDSVGEYKLNRVKGYNKLVFAYSGYEYDTLTVEVGVKLINHTFTNSSMGLDDVTIQGRQKGNFIAANGIVKNETISFAGLCKMACCSLAESFENSAAVTVGYSDAISGARQIKMLGLVGTYTQILDEGRPIMRGLSAPYGLSYTPGMWLNSIQVSKGISSVTSGSEAITGQINLEYRKPTDDERLFVNGYINHELRTELNVSSAIPVSKDGKLSTIFLFHGSLDSEKGAMDHNGDGFRDTPNTKQINIANRWLYMAEYGFQTRVGAKLVIEERLGGEMGYSDDMRDDMFKGVGSADNVYGSLIKNREFNTYIKMGAPVGRSVFSDEKSDELRSSIAFVGDFNSYKQESYFGLNNYEAGENSIFLNLMYNHYFTYKSLLKVGLASNIQNIDENLDNSTPWFTGATERLYDFDRQENISGAYAEYTYSSDNFSAIIGTRGDYNSYYKKSYFTPRGQVRWNVTPTTTVRGSAGMGYRSTNLITDNLGVLATGRQLSFKEGDFSSLDRLEAALTAGGSITQVLSLVGDRDATISVDYFRTQFNNQVIVDYEYVPSAVTLYNSDKSSYTNNYQIDFMWTPTDRIEVFATYRYTSSSMTLDRPDGSFVEVERPLVPRFKTLLNLQYALPLRRWVFDVTAQYNGESRIPSLTGDLNDSTMSPAFPMFFAQVSRKVGGLEIYLGCENIANYRQSNPILGADNPYSEGFNSAFVWGPLMGRKFYAGFRYNLY